MKQAEPDELEKLVTGLIKGSPLASRFRYLTIDAEEFDEKSNFIRILVHMSDLDGIRDDDFDGLTSSIEREVIERDDRFPSVRFSDL